MPDGENMPRMTKAQARRRLNEARAKMLKVYVECSADLSTACQKSLVKMSDDLVKIVSKLK